MLTHMYNYTRSFFRNIYSTAALLHNLSMDENLHITVRRSHLLSDALREGRKSKFNAKMCLKVREFWVDILLSWKLSWAKLYASECSKRADLVGRFFYLSVCCHTVTRNSSMKFPTDYLSR